MRLSILEHTTVNLGDHGAEVISAHAYIEGETVEDMARRVFRNLERPYFQHDPTDRIEIRIEVEPEPPREEPF